MSDRNILNGRWVKIENEREFNNVLCYGKTNPTEAEKLGWARVQRGKYDGPEKYYVLQYQQRCPRNCCWDDVVEILTREDVVQEIKESMSDLAIVLKQARTAA